MKRHQIKTLALGALLLLTLAPALPLRAQDGDLLQWINDRSRNAQKGGWVSKSAGVDETVYIATTAKVLGSASVQGKVRIYGNAVVSGEAFVEYDYSGTAEGNLNIYGNAVVTGNASVKGAARIYGSAQIQENATISGGPTIYENAVIKGRAIVRDQAMICGNAIVGGDAIVGGNVIIRGYARLYSGTYTNGVVEPAEPAEEIAAREAAINARRIKQMLEHMPYTNSLGMIFVYVPGTSVKFCIWDTRVQDYRAYAERTSDVDQSWKNPGFEQGDTHPVVAVSWNDAKAFCEWLSQKEGKTYRLPTDAEWRVAVGDTKYPWGNDWPPPHGAGNYDPSLNTDEYKNTSPVGSFAANQYGLYDMGGNVAQWCEDSFREDHIVRGAPYFFAGSDSLKSSYYLVMEPEERHSFHAIGFRCVLVAGP